MLNGNISNRQIEQIEQREYLVVKANDLIQKTNFNLSEQEQKIILYLISKIKKNDIEFNDYEFNLTDFYEVCGVYNDSGKNYSHLKGTLKNLADKSFWVKSEDGTMTLVRWFTYISIVPQSVKVNIRFHDMLKPYLLHLSAHFTQYRILYPLVMKSQYSIRLYEILKSYENLKRKVFGVDELKLLIAAQNHKQYSDFRKRAVDIAVRDINRCSDLDVSYSPIRDGMKIVSLDFMIGKKALADRIGVDMKNQINLNAGKKRGGGSM